MSAIYSLGAILVLPVVPLICDKLGRRGGIVFGSILMLIGAAIQTASQSSKFHFFASHVLSIADVVLRAVAMFIISRFILGMGIPFAIVAASSLIGGATLTRDIQFVLAHALYSRVVPPKSASHHGIPV